MMMKMNAIIVDLSLREYPEYFKIENINISLLIVEFEHLRERVHAEYPDVNIYTVNEIANWTQTFVTYAEIQEFTQPQLKYYRYATRLKSNKLYDAKVEDIYYSALAFWLYHFKQNISLFLLILGVEHGDISDSLPLAIAKKYNIPTLQTEIETTGKSGINLCTVKDGLSGNHLNLKNICPSFTPISFDKAMFDKDYSDITEKMTSNINSISPWQNSSIMQSKLMGSKFGKILLASYRQLMKKSDIFCKISNNIPKTHFKLIAYLCGKYIYNTINIKDTPIQFKLTYKDFAKYRRYDKKLKKHYCKYAQKTIGPENSIVYFMHQEPEASIMNRTSFNSQLYNIKMLSAALPEKWTLYIKEHPATFNLSICDAYFMITAPYYKNKQYYLDLISLPNVKLLRTDINSSDLLLPENYPQIKALATITGTISLEVLKTKKPIILFEPKQHPIQELNELLFVYDIRDIQKIMKLLVNGYHPEYNDYSKILSQYIFTLKTDYSKMNLNANVLSELIKYISEKHNLASTKI